jgi:glycerol-3-phosphate dehydrogenase
MRELKAAPAYSGTFAAVQSLAQPEEPFDVVVIGGGIVGAGTAALAARLGLRVALLERHDFAAGTSSASSKLVHGGLRYLRMGDVRLVREALRESGILRRHVAPHLVRDLRFVLPVYGGAAYGPLAIGAAMTAYGALALRRTAVVSPARARRLVPPLRDEGLRAAGLYCDAQTNDARLVLANVRAAADAAARWWESSAASSTRATAWSCGRATSSTRPARPSTRSGDSRIREPARR